MAALNINGTHFEVRQQTLKDFIQYKDIGIIFLQEMINSDLQFMTGYAVNTNVGREQWGTAILTSVRKLPNGTVRAGAPVKHIYAPPRCINRKEREKFFIMYLLRHLSQDYITGGDLNYVTSRENCTGDYNPCKALDPLVENFDLVDV
jgi:exonuclease III